FPSTSQKPQYLPFRTC
ncbi:bacterial extracellular solute-binding s, 5 Middle family protein, partial [Chlamydia psittaci 84-8471/1]